MDKCKSSEVTWAIFSDLYGVWFSPVEHEWYEKNPDTLTEAEYETLRSNFDEQLATFSKIFFYYPDEVHPFHRRLLDETALADRVKMITQLSEIV
jgi:hypothetical protein